MLRTGLTTATAAAWVGMGMDGISLRDATRFCSHPTSSNKGHAGVELGGHLAQCFHTLSRGAVNVIRLR